MNWQITDKIKEAFEKEGFNVSVESSKTTDYITLEIEGGWRPYSIRISDHEPMTGRSKCADIYWTIDELYDEWKGKFEGLAENEDGEKIAFDTKEECTNSNVGIIVADVKGSTSFYQFTQYTKFQITA